MQDNGRFEAASSCNLQRLSCVGTSGSPSWLELAGPCPIGPSSQPFESAAMCMGEKEGVNTPVCNSGGLIMSDIFELVVPTGNQ